ncbi:MAG TPA: 6-phosphogluconolactonase [Solirubrobacteraceae bacterium]|nr:6-phosphogluconolactonase [Solirubrobacteraceae bacterium]
MKLLVVDEPARACADRLLEAARSGGNIGLTGGSTPREAYGLAAREPDAWEGVTVWFSDERCVPPDDERSNYGLIRDSLLPGLTEAPPKVVRMKGELGPFAGADDYERSLREAGTPALDLLLLGMGPDGHLASLFPDQAMLSERSRLVVGVPEAGLEPFVPRISLTFTAIAAARQVLYLVTGASKADAAAAAFGEHAKPDPHVPSSLLPELTDRITVLLDRDAAAKL